MARPAPRPPTSSDARRYASYARSYGASVTEIYSPYATWTKVRNAAQGANILIYLGHGNGYPSPYGSFQRYTKDGFGLNATSGNGNSNVKYWGEYYIDRDIQMAPNAVVILARLCYASGNSEWGAANPTKSTAIKRVDNYGAGFLRAGAKAVFAEGINDARYIIKNLYTSNRNMREIFFAPPAGPCRTGSTSCRAERRGPSARWTRTSRVATTARSSEGCR